jgi:hypothetical protein
LDADCHLCRHQRKRRKSQLWILTPQAVPAGFIGRSCGNSWYRLPAEQMSNYAPQCPITTTWLSAAIQMWLRV